MIDPLKKEQLISASRKGIGVSSPNNSLETNEIGIQTYPSFMQIPETVPQPSSLGRKNPQIPIKKIDVLQVSDKLKKNSSKKLITGQFVKIPQQKSKNPLKYNSLKQPKENQAAPIKLDTSQYEVKEETPPQPETRKLNSDFDLEGVAQPWTRGRAPRESRVPPPPAAASQGRVPPPLATPPQPETRKLNSDFNSRRVAEPRTRGGKQSRPSKMLNTMETSKEQSPLQIGPISSEISSLSILANRFLNSRLPRFETI